MTVQKLKPRITSEFEVAKRYYSVVSALNTLKLTDMELNILAFIATRGSISNTNMKKTFCELFKSTENSINNRIGELLKRGILQKQEGKVRIIQSIALSFKEPVVIKITFDAETRETGN